MQGGNKQARKVMRGKRTGQSGGEGWKQDDESEQEAELETQGRYTEAGRRNKKNVM